MMGRAQAKLLIPEPGNAPLPKKKAPAFAELTLFFPPAFSLVPPTSVRACGIPASPGSAAQLQSGFSSHPPHLIRRNLNHLQSHRLCANGNLQNTFLFYLKGFWSQCEALKPSPELPTRLPAPAVTAQKSFSHQKGSPALPLHIPQPGFALIPAQGSQAEVWKHQAATALPSDPPKVQFLGCPSLKSELPPGPKGQLMTSVAIPFPHPSLPSRQRSQQSPDRWFQSKQPHRDQHLLKALPEVI